MERQVKTFSLLALIAMSSLQTGKSQVPPEAASQVLNDRDPDSLPPRKPYCAGPILLLMVCKLFSKLNEELGHQNCSLHSQLNFMGS